MQNSQVLGKTLKNTNCKIMMKIDSQLMMKTTDNKKENPTKMTAGFEH